MTNPTPRPALRKAEDADVHPAAPRPARSPRSRTTSRPDAPSTEPAPAAVAAVPASVDVTAAKPVERPTEKPVAKKAPAKPRSAAPATASKRRERKFSGNTSDHMRFAETGEAVAVAATPKKPKAPSQPRPAPAVVDDSPQDLTPTPAPTPTDAPAGTPRSSGADLLKGKTVELEVHVPKALRKAARAEANKRGLDIDTVVIDLLHAWLTDRR